MSDSENEDNGGVPKEVTEEFVEVVKNWVKIDDEIREKNQQIKELKDERKEFETFILEYMDKINENVINISDGKLRRNKSASKGALKQDAIQHALLDITQDSSKAMQMTKYIMDSRLVVERVNLKELKIEVKEKERRRSRYLKICTYHFF